MKQVIEPYGVVPMDVKRYKKDTQGKYKDKYRYKWTKTSTKGFEMQKWIHRGMEGTGDV